MKINNRVSLTIFALTASIVIASTIIGSVYTKSILQQKEEEILLKLSVSQKKNIQSVLQQQEILSTGIITRTALRKHLKSIHNQTLTPEETTLAKQNINTILNDATKQYTTIDSATIFDTHENIIAITPSKTPNQSLKNIFIESKKQKNERFQLHFINEEPHVANIMPITENFETLGYLLILTHPQNLFASIQNYSYLGDTGETLLALKQNDELHIFSPTRFNATSQAPNITVDSITSETQIITDYRNIQTLASINNVAETNWYIITKKDLKEINDPAHTATIFLIIISIGFIILSSITSIILSNSITQPIKTLSHISQGITPAQPTINIPQHILHAKNEIGSLARNLVAMVTELKQTIIKLKQTEALNKAVYTSIPDTFFITYPDGTIMYANEEAKQLLDISKNKPNSNITKAITFSCLSESNKICNPIEIAGAQSNTYFHEKFLISTQKQSFTGHVKIKKIVLNKHILGYVILIEDVTKAQQIEDAKTEFVSLASHQLRTPLSAINWYTELLESDTYTYNEEQTNYIQNIRQSNKRMIKLVNTLLNVSKIETQSLRVDIQTTTVNTILNDVLEDTSQLSKEKNISINTTYKTKHTTINTDKNILETILLSIISNAIKYSPSKSTINILVHDAPNNHLTYTISDEGIGIPQEESKHIFKKMYRGKTAKKTNTKGSGLGLYLAHSLAKELNGKIWFESNKPQGTIFHISLPVIT